MSKHGADYNEQTLRPIEAVDAEFKKEFWRNHADGGVTASTPNNPPEGWDEWKNDPTEVWEWLHYKLADTLTTDRDAAYTMLRHGIEHSEAVGIMSNGDTTWVDMKDVLKLLDTIYSKTHTV